MIIINFPGGITIGKETPPGPIADAPAEQPPPPNAAADFAAWLDDGPERSVTFTRPRPGTYEAMITEPSGTSGTGVMAKSSYGTTLAEAFEAARRQMR